MSILVATDMSAGSQNALRAAAAHARATDSRLTVLHCLDALAEGMTLKEFVRRSGHIVANAERHALAELETSFFAAVPPPERPRRVDFRVEIAFAAEGIEEVLTEEDFTLVVLGPTGAGRLTGMLFGSTAEEVVRSADVPVLVVPPDAHLGPIDAILAPVDLSAAGRPALHRAAELARLHHAHLDIVHHYVIPYGGVLRPDVEPEPGLVANIEADRRRQLDDFVAEVDLSGVDYELTLWKSSVTHTSAAEIIVERARDDRTDLVVMGTHGRRGMRRLFLGSTAFKVLRHAPCQVMVVRGDGQ